MVELRPIQWNFINGRIGPKYRGRVGTEIYYNALEEALNMVVTPQGGVMRRPGSINVNQQADGRMESFTFSDNTSYWLFFTSDTIKIYGNDDTLKDTINPSGITGSQVTEFDIDQSFDTLVVAHSAFQKKKIVRVSDTNWTISDLGYFDGPWEKINTNVEQKLDPTAKTGNIQIQAEDSGMTGIGSFFTNDDINRLIRIRHSDGGSPAKVGWGSAKITAVTATSPAGSEVDATVQLRTESGAETGFDFYNTQPRKNFRLGAWSNGLGYDELLAFFGNRLLSAKNDRIWGTVAGDINRYSPDEEAGLDEAENGNFVVTDGSALDIKLLNLQGAKIRWLFNDQVMHVGTDRGHYVLRGSTAFGPVTPSNASVVLQSSTPCADVKPVAFENIFFVDTSKRKLFRSDYNFRTDRYEETDMTYLADDILDAKVKKMKVINYPWKMIWAVLEDGDLACLSYDKENEVAAWTRHSMALGDVKDITVVTDTNGREKLYFLIYDQTNYYVEKFSDWPVEDSTAKGDYILVDSSYIDETPGEVSSIPSGLDRFDGIVPKIIKECDVRDQTTAVSGGGLTIDNPLQGGFHVGIDFTTKITTLPLEYADGRDSTIGRKKQAAKLLFGLYKTLDLQINQKGLTDKQFIKFRDVDDDFSAAPDLFTGQGSATPFQKAAEELQFEITQTKPAPLWINYIGYKLQVS